MSTNPGAIRLTRTGASSRARLLVRAGIAAVTAEISGPAEGSPTAGAADQQQASGWLERVLGQAGDLNGQHDPFEASTDLADVELGEGHVARTGARHEHVVDQAGEIGEELGEPIGLVEVESGDACAELEADSMQPVRFTRGQDQVGSLLTSASGRLQADPGAAAEHQNGLVGECGVAAHAAPGFMGLTSASSATMRPRSSSPSRV